MIKLLLVAIQAVAMCAATIALPASPFGIVTSRDGAWIFVSLVDQSKKNSGVAVLRRSDGDIALQRVIPFDKSPAGMVLTHDGKVLIAAAVDSVALLDVDRMTSGKGDPLITTFNDGAGAGSIYVNVTADDKILFVSEERAHSITIIDLARVRSKGYDAGSVVGKIPTGMAPIALTFSSDGRWLYTTSQGALQEWNWPMACKPEGREPSTSSITRPEGAIVVIDVNRARVDPSQSVTARVPAGCSPVRLAMSPTGDRIYTTARNSNAVLMFDTAKLTGDPEHARLGMATVGTAPVPIAVIDGGKRVIAGNSNRFGGGTTESTLTVLDAAKIASGGSATLGTIPVGAFPRDLSLSLDGKTILVANFGSKSLQVIDLEQLP